MKVTLDYDACHGHQSCAIAAPEVFGADGEIPAELEAKTRRAVGNCPEHALTIED